MSEHVLAGDDPGLDGQLLDGALEGGLGDVVVGIGQLEQHAAGLHHRHPALGVALARAHAGLGRLLGDGLVREHVDPDLAAPLDVAGHGDSGRLDLAGGDPARVEVLDAVLAERQLGAAGGVTSQPAAVLLAVLDLAGHQHADQSSPGRKCGVSWLSRVRRSISSSWARRRSRSGSASLRRGASISAGASGTSSAVWRRPADDTTRRGVPWPDVSPTAMAASRAILSSICDLYGRMSPL